MDNRRKSDRTLQTLKVTYSPLKSLTDTPLETGTGQTFDISRKGLSILLEQELAVPQIVQLKIEVPGHLPLMVLGKSVYCLTVESISRFRVGIKFVGLLPVDLEAILQQRNRSDSESD